MTYCLLSSVTNVILAGMSEDLKSVASAGTTPAGELSAALAKADPPYVKKRPAGLGPDRR